MIPAVAPSGQAFTAALPGGHEYSQLLAPGQSVAMRSGLVTLLSGQECGAHSTGGHEEMLICLEGAGRLELEAGRSLTLERNHVAYVPPLTRHNVRNPNPARLRYIYVVSPVPPGYPASG
jgi:mannose-6-phosphate isomerase-like protein (cupin superfamily)